MARNQRVFYVHILYVLIDIACVLLSIYWACVVRARTLPFEITWSNLFLDYSHPFHVVFVFLLLAVPFFNNLNGLYQTRREIQESIEIWEVFKSVTTAVVVTIVMVYTLKVEGLPRSILILTTCFLNISLALWRIAKRYFVEYLVAHGYNNFNVLVIGAGKVGMALVEEIEKRPGIGLKVVGFLDDFKPRTELYAGHKVIGKILDFPDIAKREFINKIFITIHHDSKVFLQILEEARAMRIAVRVIPQGFDLSTGEFYKYNIGFIPILEYCDDETYRKQVGKRSFDIVVGTATLLAVAPFMALIALLIKLDSPGPVFYFSRRYGRRGRPFLMLKFRSMVTDADHILGKLRDKNEVDGPIFKMRKDPRITRIGQILRRYSLDEVPQLINVIRGEMSLVGPRPLPMDQVEKEDFRQLKRLEVKPGITGLWQIRGRSDISFSRLVKWDIWYINNWSFWLDMNILWQTIPVVLHGRGAY